MGYPEIKELQKVLRDHNIRLFLGPTRKDLPRPYRTIRFNLLLNDINITIPVSDEYRDADKENQPLLLQLVLFECEFYEDAEDFLVWARDSALDSADLAVQRLYKELSDAVPKILEIIGPDVIGISSFDFEMNAGPARVLRGR